MTDKYRVHEIARFNYSDIGEYIDEYHTDRPLRNDILVELLNGLAEENVKLKQFKQSVFNLIDKSLKKDKSDYEMTYEDYLNGRIEALEELKKELEE